MNMLRRLGYWLIPVLATAALVGLAMHKSTEAPVVFNRYSWSYTILLSLTALLAGLLWRRSSVLRTAPPVIPLLLLFVSGVFLFDFVVLGLMRRLFDPSHVNLVLLGLLVIETNIIPNLRNRVSPRWRFLFASLGELALLACSIVMVVILAELGLRFFLLERLTPQTD